MIKRYPIALLISSILLLSACQDEPIKQPVEDEQQIEHETIPIEKIKKDALYSWEMPDMELYLVADGGSTEVIDATSLFGEEGNKQYNGNLALMA